MSLASGELSAADVAAVMGNNGGNGGWNEGGSFWIVILFLFALMGGYGNGGWGNGGFNGAIPWAMGNNDVQRGFDQSAVMNGITGLTTAVSNGFANAEVSRCNGMTNILQALNNNQMNFTNQFNAIAMAQQQGMYNQTVATNDLKYTVATEACADRAAVSDALRDVLTAQTASTQMILNQMNQDKLDAKNEQIQALQNQLYLANLTASQNAQTAAIIANNEAQTAALENYLSPPVRPAYLVANPNCCQNQWNGCGCGM